MRDRGPTGAYSFADSPLRGALARSLGRCPLVQLSRRGCICLQALEPLLGADCPGERPLDSLRLHSMFRGLCWVVERLLVVDCIALVGEARSRVRLLLASSDVLEVTHAGRLRAAAVYRGQANATRRGRVDWGRMARSRGPRRSCQVMWNLGGQARTLALRYAQVALVGEAWALLRSSHHPSSDWLRAVRLRCVGIFIEVIVQRRRTCRQLPLRKTLFLKILNIYADGLLFELLHGRWRLQVGSGTMDKVVTWWKADCGLVLSCSSSGLNYGLLWRKLRANGSRLCAPLRSIIVLIECSDELARRLVELALPLVVGCVHSLGVVHAVGAEERRALILRLEPLVRIYCLVLRRKSRENSTFAGHEVGILISADVWRAVKMRCYLWGSVHVIHPLSARWRGGHALPASSPELPLDCAGLADLVTLRLGRSDRRLGGAALAFGFTARGSLHLLVIL